MANRSVTVAQQLAALGELSRTDLADRWQAAHGCPAPNGIKRPLLELSAAWSLQAKRFGGLNPEAKRHLAALIAARRKGRGLLNDQPQLMNRDEPAASSTRQPQSPKIRRKLHPGDRLVREWNGRSHVVEVIKGGFAFDGRNWNSLSAIARRITGAHWSGPRFFGL
jgi:Protein of unknown function (DUF2924)